MVTKESNTNDTNKRLPTISKPDSNSDSIASGRPGRVCFVPVLRHGSASDKGPRQEMQDCHVGCDSFEAAALVHTNNGSIPSDAENRTAMATGRSHAFYAIFDGHGGVAAAQFASAVLLDYICEHSDFLSDPQSAMSGAFLRTDWEYFQKTQRVPQQGNLCGFAGTTALAAIVTGQLLVVANAGDSRAVLSRAGKAIELSSDHKPLNERSRISAAGGYVCPEERINGELTVSRAIGDYHLTNLKVCKNNALEGPLTAEPDVKSYELDDEDEFLIMACDGLWDVVSSQQAVTYAASRLRQDNNPARCAQDMVQYAIDLKSGDNVSVIVVCFREEGLPPKPAPPPRTRHSMLQRGRSLSSDGLSTLSEALRAPPVRIGSRLQSETLSFSAVGPTLASPTAVVSPTPSPNSAWSPFAGDRFAPDTNGGRFSAPHSDDAHSTPDSVIPPGSSFMLDRTTTIGIPELGPLTI